jgi:hypothetical protein
MSHGEEDQEGRAVEGEAERQEEEGRQELEC